MLSFFQAWYKSQFGLGQVLSFFFAWYLSQVRVCQVRFFFFLVSCASLRRVAADGQIRGLQT